MLSQYSKILPAVTSLVLCLFVIICPEELQRWRCHEQQSSWPHTFNYLPKNLHMIRDVFENIEKKNNIPFLIPGDVKQIDLVMSGEKGGRPQTQLLKRLSICDLNKKTDLKLFLRSFV